MTWGLTMKGKCQAPLIVALVFISLAFLLSSTFSFYYTVASADFISHLPKFESFDQDILTAASVSKFKAVGLHHFSITSVLRIDSIERISFFSFLTSSLDQRTPILRC